jgi:xylulose-5-phosphate/fructose-6-phosphate phosphoketolase
MQAKMTNLAKEPLSPDRLREMNAYWRAANCLSVGQIHLDDNLLLKKPLQLEHVKPRLLGHWGITPGLNFIYVHLNRIIEDIKKVQADARTHGFKRRQHVNSALRLRAVNLGK